jgi:hypothetical protein
VDYLKSELGMSNNTAIYIGTGGSLRRICRQHFEWKGDGKVIVVIWHPEWKGANGHWLKLARVMKRAEKARMRIRTLIAFFGASIDEFFDKDAGDRLPLLFRLLGRDPASRAGCCPITDFDRMGNAPIPFEPAKAETALILKANGIMGLCYNESKNITKPS